jgi:hypothetical protein
MVSSWRVACGGGDGGSGLFLVLMAIPRMRPSSLTGKGARRFLPATTFFALLAALLAALFRHLVRDRFAAGETVPPSVAASAVLIFGFWSGNLLRECLLIPRPSDSSLPRSSSPSPGEAGVGVPTDEYLYNSAASI